jgi:hypothetical protein
MASLTEAGNGPSIGFSMAAVLMIVARDRADLYDRLRKEFADDRAVAVVLDRRRVDRRQAALPVNDDRRHADRRRRAIDEDLRRLGWATARAS